MKPLKELSWESIEVLGLVVIIFPGKVLKFKIFPEAQNLTDKNLSLVF